MRPVSVIVVHEMRLRDFNFGWIVTIIGVWSEDKSSEDSAAIEAFRIPFVIQKSIKSGSLFGSDGQYVGLPVDTCDRFIASMVLKSSRPFGEIILDHVWHWSLQLL